MSAEEQEEMPESEGAAADASAEEPEATGPQQSEERPVIDVHMPHGGLHTWKDFWIHLGTITLGLLIAISLEQSVEWVHRVHERHELEENLRTESENNHRHAQIDIAIYDNIVAWLVELQRGVDETQTGGRKAAFVYPARPEGIPDSPRYVAYHVLQTEVWTTAKESSLLVLLPPKEADLYARLYIQTDQVELTRDRARELGMAQGAFETRYAHGTYPPQIDIAKLTPAQLDEYQKVLSDELEAVRIARVRLRIFAAANDYVLSGGTSEDGIRNAILKANLPQ